MSSPKDTTVTNKRATGTALSFKDSLETNPRLLVASTWMG
jgi:hypothetical protein